MTIHYQGHGVTLHHGDCLDVLRTLPDASVDSVVTDPPYGLEFMGKEWDKFGGVIEPSTDTRNRDGNWTTPPFGGGGQRVRYGASPGLPFQEWCEAWATECLRVLKPGGHLLAFGGTRTWHRLACAVEDAGFEVRDSIAWMYGQGFPKSLNVSAALDAARCRCDVGEWTHGTDDPAAESQAEHGLRDVPRADVPQAEGTQRGAGALLLPSLSEPGAPTTGRPELRPAEDGRGEPRMEGWGDLPQGEGELRRAAIRPVSGGVPADGPVGRLYHGAPSGHGPVGRTDADPNGVREPQEPRPEGQSPRESGALPDQRRPQAWGGWPVCERCSQPVIPDGLGTAAKPAFEPVVVARKPLSGTVASNVLAHGTGALNIDACRVAVSDIEREAVKGREYVSKPTDIYAQDAWTKANYGSGRKPIEYAPAGRWPANVVLDETQAEALDQMSGDRPGDNPNRKPRQNTAEAHNRTVSMGRFTKDWTTTGHADTGGASRYFYVAKADATERPRVNGTAHPTVKPLSLMRWLVRLVTPPGGTVLEPFAGSGTTVEACIIEGFQCIAIEREADYLPLIRQRIDRRRDPVEALRGQAADLGLFDLLGGEGA